MSGSDAGGIFHTKAQLSAGGSMNDAKWKRGLRVPSASIALVTTSAFATEGGQVRARPRYHSSSLVRPFSQHRSRRRGQTEISHPRLLNKACAPAALHTHGTTGVSGLRCLFTPALTLAQQNGRFLPRCVWLAAVPGPSRVACSLVACGRKSPHALETLLTGWNSSSMCRRREFFSA